MTLWRVRALALDLRHDRVPERDKLAYLLVGVGLQGLVGHTSLIAAFRSMSSIIAAAIWLAISLAGPVVVFRANAQGDGQRFLERYICLAVPLTIRLLAIWLVAGWAIYVLTGLGAPVAGGRTWYSLYWAGLYDALLIWFYARLRSWVAVAAASPFAPVPA